MNYRETFEFWLNDDYFDQKTKEELLAIRNNEKEVEDRKKDQEVQEMQEDLRQIYIKR